MDARLTERAGACGALPARRERCWPDRRRLLVYLVLALLLDALFVLVYGGCNWLTAQRTERLRLYFDWELAIPFVPGMIWAYASIVVLFVLPLFALGEAPLRRLAGQLAWATVLGGALFLLLPAEAGHARPAQLAGHAGLYELLYRLDRPHNLVPSLHVGYAALLLSALSARASRPWQWLGGAWLFLICSAVLLVHQHHVIDILGGLGVAFLSSRLVNGPPEEDPC